MSYEERFCASAACAETEEVVLVWFMSVDWSVTPGWVAPPM